YLYFTDCPRASDWEVCRGFRTNPTRKQTDRPLRLGQLPEYSGRHEVFPEGFELRPCIAGFLQLQADGAAVLPPHAPGHPAKVLAEKLDAIPARDVFQLIANHPHAGFRHIDDKAGVVLAADSNLRGDTTIMSWRSPLIYAHG